MSAPSLQTGEHTAEIQNRAEQRASSPGRISVVIPTYNRERLLPRAVRSILAQSHPHWELIVVDDGSTDGTEAVVRSFEDDRIVLLRQPNQGRSVARNNGVSAATADYVTFLDSDDEARPDWLASFAAAIHNDAPDVVSCGIDWCDETGRVFTSQLPKKLDAAYNHRPMLIRSGSYCIRRSHFLDLGGYVPGLEICEHTDLAFRIAHAAESNAWGFALVPRPLVTAYCVGETLRNDPLGTISSIDLLLARHAKTLSRTPGKIAQLLSIAGVNCAQTGRMAEARSYFLRAVRSRPLNPKLWLRLMISWVRPLSARVWTPAGLASRNASSV